MSTSRTVPAGHTAGSTIDPDSEIAWFEAGEIVPQDFDHEAHVRIGWCYLQRYPAAIAISRFTAALRSLTVRLGVPQKYHETVTWFFMIVIAERIAGSQAADWQSFREGNPDLVKCAAALLTRHYSKACLASEHARRCFVLPDLVPRSETTA